VAAITAWGLYHWLVRRGIATAAGPRVRSMVAAGIPVLLSGLTVAFSDWYPAVVVAAHWPVAEVGMLRVAMQFVALAALLQLAMEAVTGPRIAAAARVNDTAEIAHVVRRSVLGVMLLASPLLLLLVFPGELMRLFGPEFAAGALTLQILAVGQAVRLAAGPLGTVLIMTGTPALELHSAGVPS
jgi:O-antigen/teichoic acid export membrane protein